MRVNFEPGGWIDISDDWLEKNLAEFRVRCGNYPEHRFLDSNNHRIPVSRETETEVRTVFNKSQVLFSRDRGFKIGEDTEYVDE